MSYTYAVLEVPAVVYAAVRALLTRAGYEHAFQPDGAIDMHGIALQPKPGAAMTSDITIGTLLSSKDSTGRVEFSINGDVTQMDIAKAREIALMLGQAIEAAISDEIMFKFLTERIGLEPAKASMALNDLREYRQGSPDRVYPS
jgi:hypothetical protein